MQFVPYVVSWNLTSCRTEASRSPYHGRRKPVPVSRKSPSSFERWFAPPLRDSPAGEEPQAMRGYGSSRKS